MLYNLFTNEWKRHEPSASAATRSTIAAIGFAVGSYPPERRRTDPSHAYLLI
jgi:hypothetical protein